MSILKNSILFLSLLLVNHVFAQDFSVGSIPDSLRQNANTVVRFDDEIVEIDNIKSGLRKESYAVTVLDEKGESDAEFTFSGDTFRELKSFSAVLYDANGKMIKKYSKSDLKTTEYSEDLATDSKISYFQCTAPSIPYTIHYRLEESYKKGILSYGLFMPVNTFHQSVQEYNYSISWPSNLNVRIKYFNHMPQGEVSSDKGMTHERWRTKNWKALESELLSPPLNEIVPYVVFDPTEFVYDGVPGSISTWADLGNWTYSLTLGRDVLPDNLKAKVTDLTKQAKTDKERVLLLYKFLGETTRYESIQLGIGGYQPMTALEVYKTGFGDCKALTNYLKALLAVVGIESQACDIRVDEGRKNLMSEYPNFREINHVILRVPLQGETLWLECTNPTVPFGYVHQGIAGHEALVYGKDGSQLERLPDYADSLNLEQFQAEVELSPDGSAAVNMRKVSRVKIYDEFFWFTTAKASDQIQGLRSDIHLPNVDIGPYHVRENKSQLPDITVQCNWSTSLYGNKTGNRLFLPVNIFRTGYDKLRKDKRVNDVDLSKGSRDLDSINIHIPAQYEVETLPTCMTVEGSIGQFTSKVSCDGNVIHIVQCFDARSGRYKAADFPEIMAFLNKITSAYKGKIILRKKTS